MVLNSWRQKFETLPGIFRPHFSINVFNVNTTRLEFRSSITWSLPKKWVEIKDIRLPCHYPSLHLTNLLAQQMLRTGKIEILAN